MIDKDIFDFVGKGKGIIVNPREKTLGHYVCVGPTNRMVGEDENANQIVKLNFTGPPGTASALYYSLFFMLSGNGYNVLKTDEWIEVSPSYPQYYQVTAGSKKQLEGQIKEGIASAAAAVADYELVLHDKRKYGQYMDMLNRNDDQSLRAVFIDQVDIHTDVQGYPSALRSIVSRWPTIIVDFQKLDEKDDKPKEVAKKLGISEAESVILVTKNKLYNTWKNEFKTSVQRRYESLTGLENARKKSIEEYRKWIKPYIARYRMTRLGGESSIGRAETMKSFIDLAGTSTFSNSIQIWAWNAIKVQEPRKAPVEKEPGSKFLLHPYDSWVRNELILNEKTGLASIYKWLRNPRKYCPKCKKYYSASEKSCKDCNGWLEDRYHADEMIETDIIKTWEKKEMSLNPSEMYYTFFVIDVFRSGSWLKIGEIEDISFVVSCYLVSQNILLVKLLEMKCREREFEMYIDEILGISLGEEDIPSRIRKDFPDLFEKPETDKEKFDHELRMLSKSFNTMFSSFKAPSMSGFSKPGQYETDFLDRISKYYLSVTGGEFKTVKEFLKSNMGVG